MALGREVLRQIHDRMVSIARAEGVIAGRRLRIDTTVTETNIHHPSDSTLLGDGVRVLTRTMRKIATIAGTAGARLRDRTRSVKLRILEIARVARCKSPVTKAKLKQRYRQLLASTSRVVGQAKRFSVDIAQGVKQAVGVLPQLALDGLRRELDAMVPLVQQVMPQTRARVFHGNTRAEGKILSLFEPSTEVIRKGKAGRPNEFGKMVKLQEAENQIVIDYEVYERRPNDADLLIPAIETHVAKLGRTPRLVAADAAFYSAKNEVTAKAKGVKRVCIPNRSTRDPKRRREQKKRWFRNGQRSGAPDARGAPASRSGDTASTAAAIAGLSEYVAGSASASSPTISSTSASLCESSQAPLIVRPPPPHSPAGYDGGVLLCAVAIVRSTELQFCAEK